MKDMTSGNTVVGSTPVTYGKLPAILPPKPKPKPKKGK
jgi:hypothetical protein